MPMAVGGKHTYMGMNIIYNESGTVTIDKKDYVNESVTEFPEKFNKVAKTPAAANLFDIRQHSNFKPW